MSSGCSSKQYTVHVKNAGPLAGSEVVQLYMSPPASLKGVWKAPLPARRLIDFAKVRGLCSSCPACLQGLIIRLLCAGGGWSRRQRCGFLRGAR